MRFADVEHHDLPVFEQLAGFLQAHTKWVACRGIRRAADDEHRGSGKAEQREVAPWRVGRSVRLGQGCHEAAFLYLMLQP
jgi:hypothetical protein